MKTLILPLLGISMLYSCKKKEQEVNPTISNEGLTTVSIILTHSQAPYEKDTATWEQLLDHNGRPLPVDTSKALLLLKANASYTAELVLLDKTQVPYADASQEIRERSNYHLFFYQPLPTDRSFVIPTSPGDILPLPIPSRISTTKPIADTATVLHLTVALTDRDTNSPSYPIGLSSTFTTGAASNGWLRLVLRHQPNGKDGTYAPGSTDLDVGYTVKIQ